MNHGRLADFFFVGLAIVPAALAFGGLPDVAILLFVPILLVACAFGMAEQVGRPGPGSGGSRDGTRPRLRRTPGRALRMRSRPPGG